MNLNGKYSRRLVYGLEIYKDFILKSGQNLKIILQETDLTRSYLDIMGSLDTFLEIGMAYDISEINFDVDSKIKVYVFESAHVHFDVKEDPTKSDIIISGKLIPISLSDDEFEWRYKSMEKRFQVGKILNLDDDWKESKYKGNEWVWRKEDYIDEYS